MVEVSAGHKVHFLFSMFSRYGCPKLRSIKIEKSNAIYLLGTLYKRHGGTPLQHLVKTICIRSFGNHYSETRLLVLIVYGHEACNLYEVLYMIHINYYRSEERRVGKEC